jgi:hypothetical protein
MSTTPLLTTSVRPDWEELTRERALRRARYWTALQLILVFSTLLVLLLRMAFPSWNGYPVLWVLFFIPLAWTLPLVMIYRGSGQEELVARRRVLAALGIVCAALAVLWVGAPLAFMPGARIGAPYLPPVLAVSVPLLTWPLLVWTYRRFPLASRQMGLAPDGWLVNTAMGAAAGAALGLGLVLALRPPWGGAGLLTPPALPTLAWLLAYEVGLRAPGEELFFRGLVYRILVGDPSARVVPAIARVVLLNLLVYVVPLVSATTLEGRLGIVVYGSALACTSTLLRHRQHSLLPGMAANVVFSVFLASHIR